MALALARMYTGNFDMLSIRNSYHGMTQSVMGANHLGNWKYPIPCGLVYTVGIKKVQTTKSKRVNCNFFIKHFVINNN